MEPRRAPVPRRSASMSCSAPRARPVLPATRTRPEHAAGVAADARDGSAPRRRIPAGLVTGWQRPGWRVAARLWAGDRQTPEEDAGERVIQATTTRLARRRSTATAKHTRSSAAMQGSALPVSGTPRQGKDCRARRQAPSPEPGVEHLPPGAAGALSPGGGWSPTWRSERLPAPWSGAGRYHSPSPSPSSSPGLVPPATSPRRSHPARATQPPMAETWPVPPATSPRRSHPPLRAWPWPCRRLPWTPAPTPAWGRCRPGPSPLSARGW